MTLIAAWITPEFRIVASDSKCFYPNSIPTTCQKVFSNSNLAVGLYGGLSKENRDKINGILAKNTHVEIDEFIEQLKLGLPELFVGGTEINLKDKSVTHILIVTKTGDSEIYCFERGKNPIRKSLSEYKTIHQKDSSDDLFFSEQLLPNNEIDAVFRNNLTEQFEKSKQSTEFDCNNISDESLVKLFQDFYSAVYYEVELQKESIGGNKIYMAYSLNNETWVQNEMEPFSYDKYIEQKTFEKMKQIFGL